MNVITLRKKYQGTCNLNVTVENYTKTFTVTTECEGTAYCTPSINSSSLKYDGSSKELVSSTSTYGISNYYLGYKKGSQATSDGQITWTSANPTGGKLTATEAGTYYIYKKYTVNSNYYCGSNMTYTQVGTKTINQGDNPMTCSISGDTIYSANYTTATINVNNPQGTVTASLNTNSYVTISTYNSNSKTFTVTYKATGGPTTITITDTGNGNYNSITRQLSVTCVTDEEYSTQYKDHACTTQGYNITSYGTPTVTIGNLSAGTSNTTVSCSVTNSSSWYQKWKSGYVRQHSGSPTGTATWSITTQTFTSVGGSTSTITRFSKSSNTLSYSTMETNLGTDYVKITAVNSGDSSKTATAEKSITNYVTSITPKSSSNDDTTHFSYANIGAGATSASPSYSGGAVYTFSSGSTKFDSSASPSFGGSASYTRTYTLSASQNGFTAVNASTGVLTATNRGTTPGAARSSGTVTSDLVITYTHPSSLGSGKVISSTKTSTATCTQNANALTGITFTVNNQTISYNGNTTGTVTASYTSGSTKNVSNDANTSYVDNSDPDIVSFTKNS